MTRQRELLLAFTAVVLPVAMLLVTAEVVLRFLPVASFLRPLSVTAESPVFQFTPNRSFVFSRDWDLHMVNRGRINNAGFVNDQDYEAGSGLPLLAVIGDSYIEALMVPYADTLQGRLAAAYRGRLKVYSFAASGAPLSQYLVWAQHAVHAYGAQGVVINVVGNDFDESHIAYKSAGAFWYYAPGEGGELRLRLQEYKRGWASVLVSHSALARYVFINLQAGAYVENMRRLYNGVFGVEQTRYAGNTFAAPDPERVRDSLAAIDAFFRDLPGAVGLPPDRVLFTVDGFRSPEDAARGANSYYAVMRRAFMAKAEANGHEVIDLDRYFFPVYRQRAVSFSYSRDAHWSPMGHAAVAEAVRGSRLLARLTSATAIVK